MRVRLQLLVGVLHTVVCVMVSLMKTSPGGPLMWANCCWARGSEVRQGQM